MVTARKLEFGYGKEPLFRDLSLQLEPGSIYGLLGKNGAGKTSLLRILAGQLYRASGECEVMGLDPKDRRPDMLAQIFFLPEEYFVPAVTPAQYLSMYAPFYPEFDRTKFGELCTEFRLPENKRLSKYSYGQKKKFLIAFGLASGCSLLLLDEPTNGLDIPSKSQFRRLVASSITDEQIFLISTHQARDMENLIDPVIIVDEGRIIFHADMATVSSTISVNIQPGPPTDPGVLYSEKTLGGYCAVTAQDGESDTDVDLELLFNAVVDEAGRVRNLFGKGGTE